MNDYIFSSTRLAIFEKLQQRQVKLISSTHALIHGLYASHAFAHVSTYNIKRIFLVLLNLIT